MSCLFLRLITSTTAAARHRRDAGSSDDTLIRATSSFWERYMGTLNTGEVILDPEDSERLSKLIEWAAQLVIWRRNPSTRARSAWLPPAGAPGGCADCRRGR